MKNRKLPRSISRDASDLISFLYVDFKTNGKWIGAKTLRVQFTPARIDRLGRKYEPALFKKVSTEYGEAYQLTVLGILNCPEAVEDVQLLEKFIGFLKQQYVRDPENRIITVAFIRDQLHLTQDQSEVIRVLASILLHGFDVIRGVNWQIEVPFDVELLVHKMSIQEYIRHKIQERFDLDRLHVAETKVDKLKVALWVMVTTQTLTISYIVQLFDRAALPYLVIVSAWMTLYSIMKILQLYQINYRFVSPEKIEDKVIWFVIQTAISVLSGFVANLLVH